MNKQKVFGYVLITLSVLLAFVGLGTILGILGAENDGAEVRPPGFYVGYALGQLAFWLFYALLVRYLWRTGRKWVSKRASTA